MSDSRLPPVAAAVLVAAVDGLAARLRGKLDAAAARVTDWAVTADGGSFVIAVDAATTVRLITDSGSVRTPDAATCTCLLAPNCLHRAAVLAAAPVATEDNDPATNDPDVTAGPTKSLTADQRDAVTILWQAAAEVIGAGVSGSGVIARTALLRAAHEAQATGLHRAAASARSAANLIQAARDGASHYRLADLTDTIRDLLAVLHRLTGSDPATELLGQARRPYDIQGSKRLYGLCSTAVLTASGYAGVVTYVLDGDGVIWMISDLAPGDAHRAANAGNATIALGESALQHRQLARAGLIVSAATGSVTRQLGAGKAVRAVTATGIGWHDEPAAKLWDTPAATQVQRAFAALARPVTDRPAGDDLVFLTARVQGTQAGAVHAVTGDGIDVRLLVASDHPALAYRDNLRLLGRAPGLELLVIGRPIRARTASVEALAIAPIPAGPTWTLPAAFGGHVDLAYDALHSSHLPVRATDADVPDKTAPPAGDSALGFVRRNVERVVAGGRGVLALPASARYPSDALRLRRARLETGAEVLDALRTAATTRPRDAFGRFIDGDTDAFAGVWLAAAIYADAADRAVAEASWLTGG